MSQSRIRSSMYSGFNGHRDRAAVTRKPGAGHEASPVAWGTVGTRAERVAILASGPSLRGIDPDQIARARAAGVHVIAINASLAWFPEVDSWFTLDPDARMLPFMTAARPGVARFVAVPGDYGTRRARVAYHRIAPPRGITYLHRLSGNGPFSALYELSEKDDAINTGNSAYGGLGLAYHMAPARLGLFGVDASNERYAFGRGRPKLSLKHMPDLFASALPQLEARGIEVVNGSPGSGVACFPRMPAPAALDWLTET